MGIKWDNLVYCCKCYEAIDVNTECKRCNKPENPFEFIAVDEKRRNDIRHVKNALYDLYCWILDNIHENKYRSKGIDLLEAAAMQLNKAISRRDGNDERQPQS